MYPDGTLLFAAELDRVNRATGGSTRVRCIPPSDNIVEQVLQHLGLFEMMGRTAKVRVSADNVRYWRVDSDVVADGSRTEDLIKEYERLFSGIEATKMYNGLTEAMTNCRQHAYTQRRADNTGIQAEPRWWMFSQRKDGKLFVALCDLGIGINRSLLEGTRWGLDHVLGLLNKLGGRRDSHFIKAAMALDKSRTRESFRGNGLQELKNVIETFDTGLLWILSNRGFYRYSASDHEELILDFKDSILGTLVCWEIPLPDAMPK